MKSEMVVSASVQGDISDDIGASSAADELFAIEWEAVSRLIVYSSHPLDLLSILLEQCFLDQFAKDVSG